MPYYEHVFITRPEIAPQQVENLVEDIKTVIKDNGGKSVYTEYWGLRDLAYKIKKSEREIDAYEHHLEVNNQKSE